MRLPLMALLALVLAGCNPTEIVGSDDSDDSDTAETESTTSDSESDEDAEPERTDRYGENVAKGASTLTNNDSPLDTVVNGDTSKQDTFWHGQYTEWVSVDLGKNYPAARVRVVTNQSRGNDLALSVTKDPGGQPTTLGDEHCPAYWDQLAGNFVCELNGMSINQVGVTVDSNHFVGAAEIYEIQVIHQ